MSRSEGSDPPWWPLIDKRAAMREQFPSLTKVRSERPGCAADIERKRLFKEAAELKKVREQEARWKAAVEANAKRAQRRRNAEYRARRDERRTA